MVPQVTENHVPADIWETVELHLDMALLRLKPEDREAVLLRFLEGCSLAEVGARLEVSENTARMRITRALSKMRRHIEREGVALTAVLLTALLTEKAATAPLTPVPFKSILDNPLTHLGQTTLRVHQLMQEVQTTMFIKTVTITAVTAAACITAVALPLLAFSAPTVAFKRNAARVATNAAAASFHSASPVLRTKASKTPSPVQIAVHYVDTTSAHFLKASRQIPAGENHDALLLAALVKEGASDNQAPLVQTINDVAGLMDIGTPIPT